MKLNGLNGFNAKTVPSTGMLRHIALWSKDKVTLMKVYSEIERRAIVNKEQSLIWKNRAKAS